MRPNTLCLMVPPPPPPPKKKKKNEYASVKSKQFMCEFQAKITSLEDYFFPSYIVLIRKVVES